MKIEDAITKCNNMAKGCWLSESANRGTCPEYADSCRESAENFNQIANWLDELRELRNRKSYWIDNDGMFMCANCGGECGVMSAYCSDCGFEMCGDEDDETD